MSGATKSCLDCPSFLTPGATISTFGKSTGAPMCARYGHLLGTPAMNGEELAKVAEKTAATCSSHGHPKPSVPVTISPKVLISDADSREVLSDLHPKKTIVRSCAMCKNFIPDDKVNEEWGFTAGACTAKGILVLPNRKMEEAKGCEFRQHGEVRRDVTGLHLIPILNRTIGAGGTASVDGMTRDAESIIEPTEYPTDREVTPDEAEGGIRAWRRVDDPEGTGNFIYMPIFERKFFPEEEQDKIPQTGDDERPELYLDHNGSVYKILVLWRELEETPMIWGMPGIGKTEIFRHIAWLMQLPFYRISITGSTELDDLAGKMLFDKEKGTYFQFGRVSSAWGKPCVMCVDEPNTGQPEVWEFLRPMTDNSKQLTLDMYDGRGVFRHPECHLGMSANPAWNPLNVGTSVIGDADSSRLMHLEFNLPPDPIERAIIRNRVRVDGWEIDNTRLNFIMSVAEKIRELCDPEVQTLFMTWGIRPQIQVARALRWFSPVSAYRLAVADMLEPPQQKAILDQVEAHLIAFPPIKMVE